MAARILSCACKKGCSTKRCGCVKLGESCSSAECGCSANCANKKVTGTKYGVVTRQTARQQLNALLGSTLCPAPAKAVVIQLTDTHIVTNVSGTTADSPVGAASWQIWWELATGGRFHTCISTRCCRGALVGAHVYIKDCPGIYIIPHCKNCNQHQVTSSTLVTPGSFAVKRA